MGNDFKYWDPEHYVEKAVTGSLEDCMRVYWAEADQYPNLIYGTHVHEKEYDIDAAQWNVIIKRFKTKELCRKHCMFPPTYIREGKVL